ncbi:30S ribosomal protein S4 [Candidatus Woesearchaeota archaeon]|nr:30S ribosomal protein S4 [Candidatus Woesearchaeota archaeon]
MGDPRRTRKKYSTPMHPWQKSRIDKEREIRKTYGTKNKKEIWKVGAIITKFANEAKRISDLKGEEAEKEKNMVLGRAIKLGLIKEGQGFDDILGLKLTDVMERRLQTLVFKKGLALSINQARQLITHEHVMVGGRKITSPSYIVPVAEEDHINFSFDSAFCHPEHPEREKMEQKRKKPTPGDVPEKEEKKKKTKKTAKPKKGAKKEKIQQEKTEEKKEEPAPEIVEQKPEEVKAE